MDVDAICPYCGESITIDVDVVGGRFQRYVEDCPNCCHPWQVEVKFDERGEANALLARQDD